ncbi:MAG: hypothetical protein KGH59_02555 [Candidatus Micrarchaeota archaeon]|nr:hypothetical protein [Candidatus Micrarchaeota archaeon]MDE1804638.1 hypothetical protein [Candidatus Micrarchaeota archaeon]MDE1846790.1 hypothetical protein [Candidatus Micrarchaeota archaeon]
MQNIAVLTHNADIDGVGSAVMLRIKYNLPTDRLFFSSYAKEDILYAERRIRKFYRKGFVLFITDLSLNDPVIPVWHEIIKRVRSKGGSVIWFDHHPWSDEAIQKVARLCDAAIVGENENFCATEIARRELGLKDKFTEEFARIVHYSDFNLKADTKRHGEFVKHYALSIASFTKSMPNSSIHKSLRGMVSTISGGKFVDSKIINTSKKFELENNRKISAMLNELQLLGKNIALGFATGVQSTQACGAIIRKSGKDIAIVIDPKEGKASIRSRISDISGLAKRMGGGGHPHAAGFEIDKRKYPLSSRPGRKRVVERIEKEASITML